MSDSNFNSGICNSVAAHAQSSSGFASTSGFTSKLKGVFTAIVTPFSEDGNSIDYASIDLLLENQIKAGVLGLVVAGSTGEAATLSDVEYGVLVRYIVDRSEGKLVCIAGVNSSSTAKASELAKRASDSGADGLLLVTPPYNKPTQLGIVKHFEAVYEATQKPIIAYNIPGRTVSCLTPATAARLSQEGTIVGLKESSGSLDCCLDFFASVPKSFPILCGDDSMALAVMAHGGTGLVSVVSNIAPASMVRLFNFAHSGDFRQGRLAHCELLPLIRNLYLESNPIAVKAALKLCGIIKSSALRLPLTNALPSTVECLKQLFSQRSFE